MENITSKMHILNGEIGKLAVTEFIIGQRLDIIVDAEGIKLTQDEAYNQKQFGKLLDLESKPGAQFPPIWDSLMRNYAIDADRLMYSPIRYYTLHCIYYDPAFLMDVPTSYRNKGVVAVEISVPKATLVPHAKMQEFCNMIGMPSLKPMFIGTPHQLEGRIQELRAHSELAENDMGGGLIIKNEPAEYDPQTLKLKRWFVEPNHSAILESSSESPQALAREFVRVNMTRETIFSLEESLNIDPVSRKVKFRNAIFAYLKREFPDQHIDYKNRCSFHLGPVDQEEKFDKYIKDELKTFMTDVVLELNRYKNRVATR